MKKFFWLIAVIVLLSLTLSYVLSADLQKSVAVGSLVTFTGTSDGTKPIKYEFYKDNVKVSESSGDIGTYQIVSVAAEHAGTYKVVASNPFGTAASVDGVILSIGVPPSPPVLAVTVGGNRMVSKKTDVKYVAKMVNSSGNEIFQWEKNGVPMTGQTGKELNLYSVNPSYEGLYAVVVRSGNNVIRSNESQLWVLRN